ncbi:uncharacterized protein LOC109858475 [Pseudomyrmex gracilis]|uniref:uncharacterized protein LOC109858475 n=1 Tax=Pseudomyrmex gracilis TaxID=219809 RepID=UPI0009951EAA|nr:uncharacterized protein LOC109858475 [Pseudomyrmex gracilis]
MNLLDDCMRFETFRTTRSTERDRREENAVKTILTIQKQFTKKQFAELLLESCIDCARMAAIPQSAFAACKLRRSDEYTISTMSATEDKGKTKKENIFNGRSFVEGWELTPLKYNSKLMNSIWGLYNRYSVHNFKKNTDAEAGARGGVVAAVWDAILENHSPAANATVTSK